MKITIISFFLVCLISCSKYNPLNYSSILLNEGQTIAIKIEGQPQFLLGVSFFNGELHISQVKNNGRNFGVNLKNSENWASFTTYEIEGKVVEVTDSNMDGIADFMRKGTPLANRIGNKSDMVGFTSQGQTWEQIKKREANE